MFSDQLGRSAPLVSSFFPRCFHRPPSVRDDDAGDRSAGGVGVADGVRASSSNDSSKRIPVVHPQVRLQPGCGLFFPHFEVLFRYINDRLYFSRLLLILRRLRRCLWWVLACSCCVLVALGQVGASFCLPQLVLRCRFFDVSKSSTKEIVSL